MISKIARLRAKKGFTLIELVVVVAVIGILTSIVVASVSYDNRPAVGKEMAKDFFYVAQDAFSSLKITNPNAVAETERIGYFIEIDDNGIIINNGLLTGIDEASTTSASGFTADIAAPGTITHDGSADDDINCMKVKLLDTFTKYVNTTENMSGTLYVVADGHYRVEAAYWKNGNYVMYYGGCTGYFTDNNILDNGEYCCAYPPELSTAGKYFFGK